MERDAFVVPCVCDTLQRALPYGKMRLWCLVFVTHLHRFRERGN